MTDRFTDTSVPTTDLCAHAMEQNTRWMFHPVEFAIGSLCYLPKCLGIIADPTDVVLSFNYEN